MHIICPLDQSDGYTEADGDMREVYVDGWVQRIEPTPTLTSESKNMPLLEQVALYQKNELWYDALTTLAEQRRFHPNDSAIASVWENFLKSEGLDAIVQQPLVGSLPSEGLD